MLTPQNYNQDIVELSVSAWFYRNRAIAGFDNPARSLYVSVRELMENSLDACEDAQVLPDVTVLLKREEEASGTDMLSQGPETFELVVKDMELECLEKQSPSYLEKCSQEQNSLTNRAEGHLVWVEA